MYCKYVVEYHSNQNCFLADFQNMLGMHLCGRCKFLSKIKNLNGSASTNVSFILTQEPFNQTQTQIKSSNMDPPPSKEALRKREARKNQSKEKTDLERKKANERMERKRANESKSEKEARLKAQRIRQANLTKKETLEKSVARKAKNAENMRISRENETDDQWNKRLDANNVRRKKLLDKKKEDGSYNKELKKDSKRKQFERDTETEEETELRQLVDAAKHTEIRAEETEEQHKSRICKSIF